MGMDPKTLAILIEMLKILVEQGEEMASNSASSCVAQVRLFCVFGVNRSGTKRAVDELFQLSILPRYISMLLQTYCKYYNEALPKLDSMYGASTSGLVESKLDSRPHHRTTGITRNFFFLTARLSIMSNDSPNIGYSYRFAASIRDRPIPYYQYSAVAVKSVPCHHENVGIGACSSREI